MYLYSILLLSRCKAGMAYFYINIHVLIEMWVPLLAFHVLPNMFPFLM